MAKSVEYFQKIFDSEREEVQEDHRVARKKGTPDEPSRVAKLEDELLRIRPAVAVLQAYSSVGSNPYQKNVAKVAADILTKHPSTICKLNPLSSDEIDRRISAFVLQEMKLPLNTKPETLGEEERANYNTRVDKVKNEGDFEFSKFFLSELFKNSVSLSVPTVKNSGFASALAVIIPLLGVDLPAETAYDIAQGAIIKDDKRKDLTYSMSSEYRNFVAALKTTPTSPLTAGSSASISEDGEEKGEGVVPRGP